MRGANRCLYSERQVLRERLVIEHLDHPVRVDGEFGTEQGSIVKNDRLADSASVIATFSNDRRCRHSFESGCRAGLG